LAPCGIDIIGEIRGSVFGRHFKQQTVVFRIAPVKVPGNGIGRNRILESSSVGVAFDHDLDERLVDHIHFLLAVLIAEIHFLSADNCRQLRKIMRYRPVQRHVGKRSLRTPAARRIHTVDERLNILFDLGITEVVRFYKRRKIRIKRGERLRACPFILHDAKEIHHLIAQRGKMLCRSRCDLARNASESFLDQLLQRPPGAIAGKHGKIMNMNIRVAVRVCDFLVIDFTQPVVGGDCAGVGKNQTADRIGNGGILLDPPVQRLQITVNQLFIVQGCRGNVADILPLFPVKDICFRDIRITGIGKHALHTVLNILNPDFLIPDLVIKITGDLQGNHIQNTVMVVSVTCIKCLLDRSADLLYIKFRYRSISFYNSVHTNP